jgi:hypothetical protein
VIVGVGEWQCPGGEHVDPVPDDVGGGGGADEVGGGALVVGGGALWVGVGRTLCVIVGGGGGGGV